MGQRFSWDNWLEGTGLGIVPGVPESPDTARCGACQRPLIARDAAVVLIDLNLVDGAWVMRVGGMYHHGCLTVRLTPSPR